MPARVLPKLTCGLTVASTVLLLAGCAVIRRPPEPNLTLAEADLDFAKALAHYSQGLIHENQKGRGAAEAHRHFSEAAALDPGQHRLHAKVAAGFLLQRRADEAVETLRESCAHNPTSLVARVDLARAYQIAGDSEQAVRQFEKAIKLEPSNASLHLILADLYFHLNRDLKAIQILDQGYDRVTSPESIRTYCYSRAMRFVQDKQSIRAVPCFEFIARRTQAEQTRLYHLIGELYEAEESFEPAKKFYELATRGQPPLPQSFVKLALLQLRDDPAAAIATLVRGEQEVQGNLLILMALGQFYSSESRLDNAVKTFRRISELVKQSDEHTLTAGFYLQYGAVCEQSGLIEEAERIFEDCIKAYPDAHQVLNYLAYMWAESGVKLDLALTYIERALEHEPDSGAYLDTRGWIHYKMKNFEQALVDIQKAAESIADDPTVSDHLGDTYQALGRHEQAIASWTASFLANPEDTALGKKLDEAGVDLGPLRRRAEKARP